MRVTFLDHSAALSGAELFLLGMLTHSRKVRPTVVLFEDGPMRSRFEDVGIPVLVCELGDELAGITAQSGSTAAGPSRLAAVRHGSTFLRDLRAAVASTKPELVYSNSAKAHVLCPPLGRVMRRPTVVHMHDRVAPDTFSRTNMRVLSLAARMASHVIANSRATAATLPPRREVTVLPCPAPPLSRAPDGTEPPSPSIAVVGRLAEWKGQIVALRALRLLRETYPDLTLHLYGAAAFSADRAYAEHLLQVAEELGVGNSVSFHGHVPDVVAAMQSHTLVAHTSIRPEPFGQVILEAMASGVPVIAAAAGGPRELVEDRVSGLLYPPDDAGALAAALDEALSDPRLRSRLREGGYRQASAHSHTHIVPRWEALLTMLAQ